MNLIFKYICNCNILYVLVFVFVINWTSVNSNPKSICGKTRKIRIATKLVNFTKKSWLYHINGGIIITPRNVTYPIEEYQNICCKDYVLDNLTGSCKPECHPKCINANCIVNNVCVCHKNHYKSNVESHQCYLHCPCRNGYCSTDGRCNCLPGYQINQKNKYECDPTCTPPCIKGFCSAINVCTCYAGFEIDKHNRNICNPICDDGCHVNAYCDSPNICKCKDGYYRNFKNPRDDCIPYCRRCSNEHCLSPNICECIDGYQLNKNGNCVIKCNPGYIRNAKDVCEPVCTKFCINGFCKGPEICECLPTYSKDPNNPFICIKYNNNSTCKGGFHKINNKCIPRCTKPCRNGKCTNPDECTCNQGYRKASNSSCLPYCSKVCLHGVCKAPENCICNEGYIKDKKDNYKCHLKCDSMCKNGTCISHNQCACIDGFTNDISDSFNCIPKCSKPCNNNSKCVAPEYCECNQGYIKDHTECVPHCSNKCINAHCVAPDKCECLSGFERDVLEQHKCNKICSLPCINGYCNENDLCVCRDGYILSGRECISVCKNCTNGYCENKNKCICNQGFVKKHNSTCTPECTTDCENEALNTSNNYSCWNILYSSIGICLVCIILLLIVVLRKYYPEEMVQNTSSWLFLKEFTGFGNVFRRSVEVSNNTDLVATNSIYYERNSVEVKSITEEEDMEDYGPGYFFQNPYFTKHDSHHNYENDDHSKLVDENDNIYFNPIYSEPMGQNCDSIHEGDYAFVN